MKALPGDPPSRIDLARRWLTSTFAGRALAAGACIKLVTIGAGAALGPLPGLLEALDTIGGISLVIGVVAVAYRLFVAAKRRLLWRVRRKLTLSYIFIGFVPALLIITFFLLNGLLLFFNVSSYLMQSRVRALVDQTRFLAQTAALELQRMPASSGFEGPIERRQASAASRYPGASYAVVPVQRNCGPAATSAGRTLIVSAPIAAGPWAHVEPPRAVPFWVTCDGHAGLLAYRELVATSGEPVPGRTRLAVRAAALPDVAAPGYAVIVDVPISDEIAHQFRDDTGIELGDVGLINAASTGVAPAPGRVVPAGERTRGTSPPGRGRLEQPLPWVAFLDFTDWDTGRTGSLTVSIGTSIADIYARISASPSLGTFSIGQILLTAVAFIGVMFLVIQFVAFLMGFALARSITGSVHQLFVGTQRVQQGDFNYKIPIRSHDQLGELARSFNEMTTSIEDLLQQKQEKERLEQELRIARKIQMSLLPQGPLLMPGLALTAHCEPAREVGGDYYDFLPLDTHRLGILIADVSGKGTSAALYMAELKGLMLSLSQLHTSPRQLLIAANRIISHHLDSRSFITMTYAIVDMQARTLTYARAGHCPLIYLPAPNGAGRPCDVQILAPDGLVLGLKIDDGAMFERLLQEDTVALTAGDLFVLFTDGISEAMNPADECFGETRLGDLVHEHGHLPSEELRERILREIRSFVGTASQHDDMTMLLLKVQKSSGDSAIG
ncbi:MAG: PP2C family protein-serine/threonine phosphatase [Vicinamibacterales bacterium]